MNGYQRIQAALKGEQPDKVPVMLHSFMFAAKQAGYSMEQFRSDPQILAESFIRSVETYGYDGIFVDVDTVTLAGAVGVPIEFRQDDPAASYLGCLDHIQDIAKLSAPDIQSYGPVQIWLEAVSQLKNHFKDEIYIRGNCDQAPFSLASMMRSPQNWFLDLIQEPNLVMDLLDYCSQASCQFIDLMAQTGADMLSNGDSPAGPDLISPEMYREYALPYEKQVCEAAHKHGLPYALHICGNTDPILDSLLEVGAEAYELDFKTDIQLAHDTFLGKATFMGNLDPVAVLQRGSPEVVQAATQNLIQVFRDTPHFILNAGCAIPAETPPINIQTMIKTAHQA